MSIELKDCFDAEGKITNVPDHILDMVVERAQAYFNNPDPEHQKRFLGAYGAEAQAKIGEISTHHIFDKTTDLELLAKQFARRELHRSIILDMIRGKKGSLDGNPTTILFCGAPGAGKSTLRARFNDATPFENANLEAAHKEYLAAAGSCLTVNFQKFKDGLSEYNAANTAFKAKDGYGDMYAVIRSEASGLNESLIQFAREAGLPMVLEQLMDVDLTKNQGIAKFAEGDFTVIGVTADPELIRSRVAAREKPMQDAEVVGAIQRSSNDNAFPYLAQIAGRAVLVDTNKDYKVVYATEKGKETYKDKAGFAKFKSLIGFKPAVIGAVDTGKVGCLSGAGSCWTSLFSRKSKAAVTPVETSNLAALNTNNAKGSTRGRL